MDCYPLSAEFVSALAELRALIKSKSEDGCVLVAVLVQRLPS
jgi:hypothetical protein